MLCVGISWQDKITTLRAKMSERKITWFVATALDEIACTVQFSYPAPECSSVKLFNVHNLNITVRYMITSRGHMCECPFRFEGLSVHRALFALVSDCPVY